MLRRYGAPARAVLGPGVPTSLDRVAGQPVLRMPAAIPVIVASSGSRASSWPPRARASSSTCRCESGSIHGLRCERRRCSAGESSSSDGAPVSSSSAADDLVVLARDVGPEAVAQRRLDEPQVALRDAEVGLVERHLERREEAAEERPARRHLALQVELALGERGPGAVPGGQQQPVLRPREHPRDRAQRLDPARRALGRARADVERRELGQRRRLLEEAREVRATRRRARGSARASARPSAPSPRATPAARAAARAPRRAAPRRASARASAPPARGRRSGPTRSRPAR